MSPRKTVWRRPFAATLARGSSSRRPPVTSDRNGLLRRGSHKERRLSRGRGRRGPPELEQEPEVRRDRPRKREVRAVADAILCRHLLDDARQGRVMQVADPREQMVLDLVIQAAQEPREDR